MSRSSGLNAVLRTSQSYTLAQKAFSLMQSHGIWPTPENYEIWIAYAHGDNLALNGAIDGLIKSKTAFTDAVCADLSSTFGQQGRMSEQLNAAGSDLGQKLGDMLGMMAAAEQDTAAYGEALQGASGELRKASMDEATIRAVVEKLANATQQMEERTRTLEEQLTHKAREASELRNNLEQMREEALTDALSGLPNRRRFEELLDQLVADAHASGAPLCAFVADIDHFKRFNDTWGHQTGDQVIRFVASCLKPLNTGKRLAARYGGEEFVVILPEVSLDDATQVAENVRQAVQSKKLQKRSTGEDLGAISISIGVAQLVRGETAEQLIARADKLLYEAKHSGRNRVVAETALRRPTAAA